MGCARLLAPRVGGRDCPTARSRGCGRGLCSCATLRAECERGAEVRNEIARRRAGGGAFPQAAHPRAGTVPGPHLVTVDVHYNAQYTGYHSRALRGKGADAYGVRGQNTIQVTLIAQYTEQNRRQLGRKNAAYFLQRWAVKCSQAMPCAHSMVHRLWPSAREPGAPRVV